VGINPVGTRHHFVTTEFEFQAFLRSRSKVVKTMTVEALPQELQAVLNAAARLVFRLRRYDHVTDVLTILHWLRLPERVNFKLALMAYRACTAWFDAGVFESARSSIRAARSSPSPVVIYTRAVHSVVPSGNHWPSLVSCCSRSRLEHCLSMSSHHHILQPFASG